MVKRNIWISAHSLLGRHPWSLPNNSKVNLECIFANGACLSVENLMGLKWWKVSSTISLLVILDALNVKCLGSWQKNIWIKNAYKKYLLILLNKSHGFIKVTWKISTSWYWNLASLCNTKKAKFLSKYST